MEAQLDAFENGTNGFFFWAFKAPGAWNFMNGARQGWIPQPLTARRFPNQCRFNREEEGSADTDAGAGVLSGATRRYRKR